MSHQKTLLIFDIDGTLTDSVTMYHQVVIDAIKQMKIDEVDTDFYHYKHHTDSYTFKYNYENFFKQVFPKSLLLDFESILNQEILKHSPVQEINGAKITIEQLKNKGFSLAFATGSLPQPAKTKLDQCGIWYHQDVLATSMTSYDRESFVLEAIEKAKTYYQVNQFDKIYSIGDGIWDLKTAQNLNLRFIGIGLAQKETLKSNGCLLHFDDLSTLGSYFI